MAISKIDYIGSTETTTITLAYGTISIVANKRTKEAWLRWNGNATAPTEDSYSGTLPSGIIPTVSLTTIMYRGQTIDVTASGTFNLNFGANRQTWTAGSLSFPIQ